MAYYYSLQKLQEYWKCSAEETLRRTLTVIDGDRDYFNQFQQNLAELLKMVAKLVIDRQKFDTLYGDWEPVREFKKVSPHPLP